jgi:hypothetical protein
MWARTGAKFNERLSLGAFRHFEGGLECVSVMRLNAHTYGTGTCSKTVSASQLIGKTFRSRLDARHQDAMT